MNYNIKNQNLKNIATVEKKLKMSKKFKCLILFLNYLWKKKRYEKKWRAKKKYNFQSETKVIYVNVKSYRKSK